MLSRSGRCQAFGAGADGMVMGEGVGAVLLKPLSRALRDGDHVHALIRGTATNSGGRTQGFTVPSPDAQAQLISAALRDGWDDAQAWGSSLGKAAGFPVEEEERSIAAVVDLRQEDGAADVCAELIAIKAGRVDTTTGDGVVGLREGIVTIELP